MAGFTWKTCRRGLRSTLRAVSRADVIAIALLLCVCTILVWSDDFSQEFKRIKNSGYANCSQHNVCPRIVWFRLLRVNLNALTAVVDKHSGIVIAIYTIVLALFTIRLARATDRLVVDTGKGTTESIEQAARAADAMHRLAEETRVGVISANRAIITLHDVNTRGLPSFLNEASPVKTANVSFKIYNWGRTPATVRSISHGVAVHNASDGSDAVTYKALRTVSERTFVIGGRSASHEFDSASQESKSHETIGDISAGSKSIYFSGQIIYSDVFDTFITTWCLRYDPKAQVLSEYGGSRYNRRT